jgi:pyridoxal phosphate enzyme (YggS family)
MDRSLEPAQLLDAVRHNLDRVRERIGAAARRAGRDPTSVALLPVTKHGGEPLVRALLELGLRDFGENRVDRILALHALDPRARWHMIGHLQRNKANKVAPALASLHSLDSLETATKLDRARAEPLDVWIEVNSGEEQKSGVAPAEAAELARAIAPLGKLVLRGLMTMPPDDPDPERARPHFRALRELLPAVATAHGRPVTGLSMGMTRDLEVAVEEGATVVRVGRALTEGVS